MKFAKNLRRIRKLKGYSVKKLSEISGISTAAIKMYEKGLSDPNLSRLIWLAEALDTTVAILIGEV